MKYFSLIIFLFSSAYAQTYCAADQIEINDQNAMFEVCYASGDYEIGDNWSLADFNGDLNGGDYHITFIDMSATW